MSNVSSACIREKRRYDRRAITITFVRNEMGTLGQRKGGEGGTNDLYSRWYVNDTSARCGAARRVNYNFTGSSVKRAAINAQRCGYLIRGRNA